MKLLITFIVLTLVFPVSIFAKSKNQLHKVPPVVEGEQQLEKPLLKVGQYTALFKGQYHIFKIKEFNNLKLSENCFGKKSRPNCQAFEIAKIKVKDVIATIPGQTNPASMHCVRMSGENLIAYDYQNKEYDYCRFSDNSLVSSWSMFNNAFIGKQK